MRDLQLKKSRGFAFVTFYNLRDAENAKTNANHEKILNNPIRVTWKKNIRDMNPDANVFVKDLDPTVTVKTLDSVFSKYGAIFSSKIVVDESGISRGYGYI
jgi:polyadenylate-binding protein